MKIIHGHDYYDSALAYGRDEDVKFIRQNNKFLSVDDSKKLGIHLPKNIWLSGQSRPFRGGEYNRILYKDHQYSFDFIKILLCGKEYGGIKIETEHPFSSENKLIYFWDLVSFQSWLSSIDTSLSEKKRSRWYNGGKSDHEIMSEHFAIVPVSKKILDWMIDSKITILVYDPDRKEWRIDPPILGQYQFFKVLDPFAIHQEIAMWVGGVLASSGNDMVEIKDDKVKIAKHGFDKFSFRKAKNV